MLTEQALRNVWGTIGLIAPLNSGKPLIPLLTQSPVQVKSKLYFKISVHYEE